MKKLLVLTSACALTAALGNAHAVSSGFTGSLGLGYSQTAGKTHSVATYDTVEGGTPVVNDAVTANPTSASVGGELTVGYRRVLNNNFVLSAALGAAYSGEAADQTFSVKDAEETVTTHRTVEGRLTHGISGIFKLKAGMVFNNFEVYLGAAALVTPFDFKMKEIADSDGTDANETYNTYANKKSSWGIAPLAGVAYHLNDKINVFAEFSQTFYRTKVPIAAAGDTGLEAAGDGNPGYSIAGTSKPVITRVLVGVQVTV